MGIIHRIPLHAQGSQSANTQASTFSAQNEKKRLPICAQEENESLTMRAFALKRPNLVIFKQIAHMGKVNNVHIGIPMCI